MAFSQKYATNKPFTPQCKWQIRPIDMTAQYIPLCFCILAYSKTPRRVDGLVNQPHVIRRVHNC